MHRSPETIEPTPRLLLYAEDRRTVVIGLVLTALAVAPYVHRLELAAAPVYALVMGTLALSGWAIVHNHLHLPLFHHAALNAATNVLASVVTGFTPTALLVGHSFNHHAHVGRPRDWSRPAVAGSGYGLVRLVRYAIQAPISVARGRGCEGAPALSPRRARRLRRERLIQLLLIGAALCSDARTFVAFTLPSWVIGAALLLGVNLLQHDACDPDSRLSHSRDFTGTIMNWFFFNGGYHTAHHLRASLHWSRLPEEHARRVRGRRPVELESRSILAYLVRHYLIPWRMR